MKEKLTLRNLVIVLAFVLGIVALIVSFNAGAKANMEFAGQSMKCETRGLIFGKQYSIVDGVKGEAETEDLVHAKLAQLGVILLVVAPVLALVAALFLPKEVAKKVVIGTAVVAVVGVVFVCMMKGSYIRQMVKHELPDATGEEKKEAIKFYKEMMKDNKPNGALIVVIVLGIVEALGLAASQFLPEKK